MKRILNRPHPSTFIIHNNPIDCIKDVRDDVLNDEPSVPLWKRKPPEVIEIHGEMDGYGNIQIRPGTTKVNYKLIR